jgi:hypothetical protein
MGSLMIEENVVAEAGTVHYLTLDEIRDSISELGFMPRQRNVHYQLLDIDHERCAMEANRARYSDICSAARAPLHQTDRFSELVPLTIVGGDGTA